MRPELAQRMPILALRGDEFGRRRRDEHLPAMPEREKPCHTVQRRPEIVAFALLGRADVNGHANSDPIDGRPVVTRECLLRRDRSADRIRRPPKGCVERVTSGLEYLAAMSRDRAAQDVVMRTH